MPPSILRSSFSKRFRLITSIRIFLIITSIGLIVSLTQVQVRPKKKLIKDKKIFHNGGLGNGTLGQRKAKTCRKKEGLQKDLRYMLLWTPQSLAPFAFFGKGQSAFVDKNCSMKNCYVTTDRNFFKGDTTKFDAIAFNGRNIKKLGRRQLPRRRSLRQKFIYFNMESAYNYPVCASYFDNYFNWTSTYRLDSDIPYPYIQIRNINDEVVGPKIKMDWSLNELLVDKDVDTKQQNKSKAVAWFVSKCKGRSDRKQYSIQLKKALRSYNKTVDVYGKCGPLKCPKAHKKSCNSMLQRDYYFYLSFENSFAEDYVTEKLLTALQHDTVPIVFGGADYSRFLPPGSYLNARNTAPEKLAYIIVSIMKSKKIYSQFFNWKSSYTYHDPSVTDNVCAVCEALNNNHAFEAPSIYSNMRRWWLPNYHDRCKT